MMNHNPFLSQEQEREWVDLYKDSKMGEKIEMLPRVGTHQEVANIMRQMDCGVFPSRAEGWNLEAIEMMSCGKQVIITDYSAHTEFCNEENSLLVNIDNKEDAYDGIWFHGQGRWAEKLDLMGWGVTGRTLGVIGLGNIGREVFTLAQAFGMQHMLKDFFHKTRLWLQHLCKSTFPKHKYVKIFTILNLKTNLISVIFCYNI